MRRDIDTLALFVRLPSIKRMYSQCGGDNVNCIYTLYELSCSLMSEDSQTFAVSYPRGLMLRSKTKVWRVFFRFGRNAVWRRHDRRGHVAHYRPQRRTCLPAERYDFPMMWQMSYLPSGSHSRLHLVDENDQIRSIIVQSDCLP